MTATIFKQGLLASLVLVATLGGAVLGAGDVTKYVWATPTPGGPEGRQKMEIIHGSARDLTDYDFHLSCVPGQQTMQLSIVTRGFGPYKPESLKGEDVNATFIVDGRRAMAYTMKMTASDNGIEAVAELATGPKLLSALEKGKTLRVELPRIKSQAIPLRGFASLSPAMRKHCGIGGE